MLTELITLSVADAVFNVNGFAKVAADIGIIGNVPRSITVNNTVDITLLNFLI
jgi:hypothetical protein